MEKIIGRPTSCSDTDGCCDPGNNPGHTSSQDQITGNGQRQGHNPAIATEIASGPSQKDGGSDAGAGFKQVSALQSLLGSDVVMLPIRPMKKAPEFQGWNRKTIEAMHDPAYLGQLESCNIG